MWLSWEEGIIGKIIKKVEGKSVRNLFPSPGRREGVLLESEKDLGFFLETGLNCEIKERAGSRVAAGVLTWVIGGCDALFQNEKGWSRAQWDLSVRHVAFLIGAYSGHQDFVLTTNGDFQIHQEATDYQILWLLSIPFLTCPLCWHLV